MGGALFIGLLSTGRLGIPGEFLVSRACQTFNTRTASSNGLEPTPERPVVCGNGILSLAFSPEIVLTECQKYDD